MFSVTGSEIGPIARDKSPEWRKLMDRQCGRENVSRAEGEQQFRAQVADAKRRGHFTAESSVGQRLLDHVVTDTLEPLEKAIADWQQETKHPTAGKPRQGAQLIRTWLASIGPRLAAYLTLKFVLDGINRQQSYVNICTDIANSIQDELQGRRLREQAPAGFKAPSKHEQLARAVARFPVDMSGLEATEKQKLQLGERLVDLLNAATHGRVVTLTTITVKSRPVLVLEPSVETNEWLTERTNALAILQAQASPMVVPPLPWAPETRGGYRCALKGKYPLVRRSWETPERMEWNARVEQAAMPPVYAALNAIQGTAWKINRDVYALVREIEQRGGAFAGIPVTTPEPLPTKHADRVKHKSKMRQVQRVLDVASDVLNDEIWFPHSLDFRGRVYPLVAYLHPQGNDLSKALLTFAQGKPLDEQGIRWLAIHGASRFGEMDGQKTASRTFEERIAWVQTNTERIERAADTPLVDTWWTAADDPLQFYAFCVEWRHLTKAKQRGEEYVSHLPVSIDGSCNGLQHYAALLRDADSGRLVNLVPHDRPQDMYQRVADVVCDRLKARTPDDPLAAAILDAKLVTRKLAKGPTMTFFYGSKKYGIKDQINEYLKNLDNWDAVQALFMEPDPEKPGTHKSRVGAVCQLLARTIVDAISNNVKKPVEAMNKFQECAKSLVAANRSPEWFIPATGFGVRQVYPEWKRQHIKTMFAGKIHDPRLRTATSTRDRRKHRDAISPNVIHSLDAAALMLTVSYAAAGRGVTSFATIHDGYAVLAADCALLGQAARQSFAALYGPQFLDLHLDTLASLYDQLGAPRPSRPEDESPARGSLDVNGVLASDYFFA